MGERENRSRKTQFKTPQSTYRKHNQSFLQNTWHLHSLLPAIHNHHLNDWASCLTGLLASTLVLPSQLLSQSTNNVIFKNTIKTSFIGSELSFGSGAGGPLQSQHCTVCPWLSLQGHPLFLQLALLGCPGGFVLSLPVARWAPSSPCNFCLSGCCSCPKPMPESSVLFSLSDSGTPELRSSYKDMPRRKHT